MKKETKNLLNMSAWMLLAGATAVGVGGILREKYPLNSQDSVPESTTSSISISDFRESLASKSPEEIQSLKSSYLFISGNFEFLYGQSVSVDGTKVGSILDPDIESQINHKAMENVLIGAFLSEHLSPDKIEVADDFKSLVFEEQTQLDLGNPLELSIASAFIENTLSEQKDEQYSYFDLPTQNELEQEAEDLKWLVTAEINIDIDSDSFAIVPKDYLVQMSRILQELRVNNLPFPEQIQFKNYETKDAGGGYYYNSKSDRPFTVVVTNSSDAETLTHEVGHFVQDAHYMDNTNENLMAHSQDKFDQMIQDIKDKHEVTELITETDNLVEEYANKFRMYFLRGDEFRYMIANATSEIKREVLSREYNFFKELVNDREFRTGFVLVEQLDNKEIKTGDIIEITDTDTEKPGIFLRPSPTLDIDASYPVVWDEDEVEILEGPAYFNTQDDGKVVEMWKVRRGYFSYGKFYEERDSGKLNEGWISREWFGRIIYE